MKLFVCIVNYIYKLQNLTYIVFRLCRVHNMQHTVCASFTFTSFNTMFGRKLPYDP